MRLQLIVAALILAAAPVQAQPGDSHKPDAPTAACHGADGKARPCAPKKPARVKAATPMITRCRDVTSHQLAKCGGPNAEPVPAN